MNAPAHLPRSPAAPASAKGRLLAVASGKGGVGKTWLSVTLAHALARLGQRVFLLDADIGLANVDIQLGLTPTLDLTAVIGGRASLAEVAHRYEAGGFDLIAGSSGTGSLATAPAHAREALLTELRQFAGGYHCGVLDLGAGLDETVRAFATRADACLVVVTDEPTSLTDAYAFIKVTARARPDADLRIVVNMAASAKAGERTYDTISRACETFLKRRPPLVGVVRRDPAVKDAIRAQAPLFVRHPNSPAAADVAAIARSLSLAGRGTTDPPR